MADMKSAYEKAIAKGSYGGKSTAPGGGGRFAAMKAEVAKEPGVRDPGAVAAAIGRKAEGKKVFQAQAAAGRKRAAK